MGGFMQFASPPSTHRTTMTHPNPIPHLDEPARIQAHVRRLERDLEAERANTARERRSNGTLALELFESRELAKALAAELKEARRSPINDTPAKLPIADTAPVVTREMAIAHYEAGGVLADAGGYTQRRKVGDSHECRSMCGGRWNEWSTLRQELARLFVVAPGFYTLLPQDNGAAP